MQRTYYSQNNEKEEKSWRSHLKLVWYQHNDITYKIRDQNRVHIYKYIYKYSEEIGIMYVLGVCVCTKIIKQGEDNYSTIGTK